MLPVVQGTSENAAHQIIDNGFGIASALDDGWYGRGIYFTSYLKYASLYAKFSSSNSRRGAGAEPYAVGASDRPIGVGSGVVEDGAVGEGTCS